MRPFVPLALTLLLAAPALAQQTDPAQRPPPARRSSPPAAPAPPRPRRGAGACHPGPRERARPPGL